MAQTQVQTQAQTIMDSLPTLTTDIVKSSADKQAALRLVADSIAQQRQAASYYLITRPRYLSALFSFYAIIFALNPSDISFAIVTSAGLTLTYLLLIRLLTADYLHLAEAFRWQSFIQAPDKEEDTVLATRFGEDLIGTLVLRLEPSENKAEIRAWTVRLRYRGKGVGGDLLRAAIRLASEGCGPDCDVEFATDHANSAQVVNSWLGRPFETRDQRAVKALSKALKE